MIIYLLLVAFGFLIQYITMNPWPGAFLFDLLQRFWVLFVVLTVMTGLKVLKPTKNWTTVDMDRIHEIRNLDYAITKWDRDVF